ncbi:TRM11 family SAM-dependent methyltransferase [Vulcanisaeta thermophila]|uniref:TRM11 family SAM-dependent methyltransferase n=1 Tax=Vulcanisaeta thermophila TaxID=867917 RepID=UPI00085384A1|nr:DNA methyltransferase [Vulcanisaeta thermophila]
MVRLGVRVSKDLIELAFYELEALADLSGGSVDLVSQGDELIVDYRGDLDRLRASLCRASLIKQVDVIHEGGAKEVLARLDRSRYWAIDKHRSTYGGVIELRIARLLVNLARAREGAVFLDPFMGSGTIVYEAAMVGARAVGIDLDRRLLTGVNADFVDVVNADSLLMPLRGDSVDSMATDPPYGRFSIPELDIDFIYRVFARESYRVLKRGGFLALSHPTYVDATDWFLSEGFELVGRGLQFVHGSLTRLVLILKKD